MGSDLVVEPTSNMEGLICQVRFSEGPACQVRGKSHSIIQGAVIDGHDNRVPLRGVFRRSAKPLCSRGVHRLRLAGLISPNDPTDFPLGLFLPDDLTFVVFLSTTAQAKEDFGYSSLEIDLEWDKSQPLLRSL
jgi:hypothetical protein